MADYWSKFSRMRATRRKVLALGAAGTGMALLGCASDGNEGASTPSPSAGSIGSPQPGGRYASYFSPIGNYNLVATYHEGYGNTGITAYDRPITAGHGTDGYQLEAMEKIELASPTKVVMTLKPDMVYHNKPPVNGRKVTAADIVATQNYVKQLPNAENSQFQRTFIDSIEAPNDTTVVINLKKPSAYLLSAQYLANPTAQPIIPQELLEALDSSPPIGSGPFELVDHTFNQRYRYKKFENFREAKRGMPYITERETLMLNDNVAMEASFRSGQVSEFNPPASIVDRLLSELDSSKFANATYVHTFQVGTNAMMNAALGGPRAWHDVRVREALYRLTNKQQWVELGFRGRAVVNQTPLPAGLEAWHMDAKDAEPFYVEDVQKANQLLSAANFDKNQTWEFVASNQANSTLCEIWAQQISRGGIKSRTIVVPTSEFLPSSMVPGKFDFWIGANPGGDVPSRVLRNQHSSTNDQFSNIGLYDKEIDALIEQSEVEVDREENIRLVKEIQKKILEKYTLTYNVVTEQKVTFYDARLQDFIIDPIGGQDYQYQAWIKA